jgi:Glycosyltransferase like family 2
MTGVLWLLAALVGGLSLHCVVNARLLRRPCAQPSTVDSEVAVLIPVRDEADRVAACLRAVLGQRGVPALAVVVLDDGSTDDTADVVRRTAGGDPRVRLVTGEPVPPGWLGKPYACFQLARCTDTPVLVFVDADVVLAPDAVAAAVALLDGFDLVSPYPKLVATGAGERLVQPLLAWSWLTFLPVRAMERSRRPSLAAAGGQFLVATRAGYERAGGHHGVRDRVLEDVELARAVKRSGGRIAIVDGSSIASCRMYSSWPELSAGYAKSLWAAFGSPAGAVAVTLALVALYVGPPLAAVAGAVTGAWPWVWAGLTAYGLGVVGRIVTARATGGRAWPDALAQPASIVAFSWLVVASLRGHRRAMLSWKGRRVGVLP